MGTDDAPLPNTSLEAPVQIQFPSSTALYNLILYLILSLLLALCVCKYISLFFFILLVFSAIFFPFPCLALNCSTRIVLSAACDLSAGPGA